MKINGYVLAGDPAYLAASVQSYYAAVERIVVAFDEDGLGWAGEAMPIEESLEELRLIDTGGKLDFHPFSFRHAGLSLLECETRVRSTALRLAGAEADWVIQLDGDEVVPDLGTFVGMIHSADSASADALDFPSRWIYARVGNRALECCTRWWRAAAGYPGPLAVRPTVTLRQARQCDGRYYRVDFRTRNTDPWHPRDAPVDVAIPVDAGVLHFSWAGSREDLLAKAARSAHRDDIDWQREIAKWSFRRKHPIIASALTPFRRRRHPAWLRSVTLPVYPRARLAVP